MKFAHHGPRSVAFADSSQRGRLLSLLLAGSDRKLISQKLAEVLEYVSNW